jgi:N-acetylglutamate synthase-like GNAT family acetyltransferase
MIRKAGSEDVEEIKRLAKSLKFDMSHPKSNSLITLFTKDEYLHRVNNSKYFYVDDEDVLSGFLICADDKMVDKLIENGMFHHNEIKSFLSKRDRPYIYGETFGVRRKKQKQGKGTALLNNLFKDMETNGIERLYVMIRHAPCKNESSIKFCEKFGIKYNGIEVSNEDLTHGIYEKVV